MKLSQFDGQCVQIEDCNGDVFEGYCLFNSAEYNDIEFGYDEEGLQMPNMLFYKSNIRKVTSLEDHEGPYGKFSAPYGKLEEMAVEDGLTMIDEVMLSEEPEHIFRLLLCMEDHLKSPDDSLFDDCEGLIELLKNLLVLMSGDAKIKAKAQALIARLQG